MNEDKPALKMIREFVAVGRASFERPHTPLGDPDAQRKIIDGIRILDDQGAPIEVSGPLVELLAPRAPFFDQCVLDAIDSGVTQFVNIGVGYDDRALRFPRSDIRFFEVDLPNVIEDKARRLKRFSGQRILPTLIPADLSDVDLSELLSSSGFSSDSPALFICEHVLLFMRRRDVDRLLSSLSHVAAPGSTLALSLEVHPEGLDTDLIVSTVDEKMFANSGLIHSIRSREEWGASLRELDWAVDASAEVLSVDHFALPVAGLTVQIQTQFIKAVATGRSGAA